MIEKITINPGLFYLVVAAAVGVLIVWRMDMQGRNVSITIDSRNNC